MVAKKRTCDRTSAAKKTLKENRQQNVCKLAKGGKINARSKQVRGTGPRDNYK